MDSTVGFCVGVGKILMKVATSRALLDWKNPHTMSNLAQALKIAGATVVVVAVGTAYVLIHEHRRKLKKERRAAAEAEGASGASADGRSSSYMSVDRLLKLLNELAKAAYTLIEQVRAVCTRKAAAALAHLLPFAAHVHIANSTYSLRTAHAGIHTRTPELARSLVVLADPQNGARETRLDWQGS